MGNEMIDLMRLHELKFFEKLNDIEELTKQSGAVNIYLTTSIEPEPDVIYFLINEPEYPKQVERLKIQELEDRLEALFDNNALVTVSSDKTLKNIHVTDKSSDAFWKDDSLEKLQCAIRLFKINPKLELGRQFSEQKSRNAAYLKPDEELWLYGANSKAELVKILADEKEQADKSRALLLRFKSYAHSPGSNVGNSNEKHLVDETKEDPLKESASFIDSGKNIIK